MALDDIVVGKRTEKESEAGGREERTGCKHER
jgi:hypothetical protein